MQHVGQQDTAPQGGGAGGHAKNIPAMLSLLEGLSGAVISVNGLSNNIRKILTSASELGKKLEPMEREIVHGNSRICALQRNSLILADFAEHALRLDIIRNLLHAPPDLENASTRKGVTDEWLAEQTDIARGDVGIVEEGLSEARLTYEIQSALRQAEFRADALLAATPIEERPARVDP